ncbi:sodium-dependent transporter [Reichenbachiella agarivorans]|uniref:Sodium-dependent transporter n=1 Tax=Reichenbachiella agarivorans TaxID=2979464 RepID=A0ABY6CN00_9BACT|nr:sodium-dependent transporter [Reichenbachiella agarivorans]UXP31895.1 sodium-dependent transporter [Reichenbachiella agarivorans]
MAARGHFSNRLGFILAAAGSAVGLGNIWKFPFEVEKGGGAAFVVLYLIFCFALCFPVMVTEIAIGRKTEKNPAGAFVALGFPKWKYLGILGIISGIIILSFYNVVAGWAFGYFIEMAQGNFEIGNQFGDFITNIWKISLYAILFMGATALIVSKGISGGIERAAKILMPSLILMILGILLYSFTLPNAMTGIKYYLIPEFSELNLATIGGALRQAFFSLSLGMGALITYGSYFSKDENIIASAASITLFDVGIAFFAGLMLFPLVSYSTGGDMSNIQGGAGLIFTVLPGVFQSLGPILGIVLGSLFFLLLSFAALTSTVSLLEVPVAYIVDEYKANRNTAVIIMAVIIFVTGIPSLIGNGYSEIFTNFVTYVGADHPTDFMTFLGQVADIFLLFGGCLIVTFAAYVWKKENLHAEIAQGYEGYHQSFVKKFINITVSYVCPVLLGLLFVLVILNNFFGIELIR